MTTVPLGVAHSRQWASMSVANGQLLVFDARAYRQSGGHAAVRGEVIEDVALMRVVRRAGHRALTVDGSHIASCRMYCCATDLIDGYTKSAWAAFSGIAGSIAVNGLLLGVYVVPVIGAVFGRGSTRAWGLAGCRRRVAASSLRKEPGSAHSPTRSLTRLHPRLDSHQWCVGGATSRK